MLDSLEICQLLSQENAEETNWATRSDGLFSFSLQANSQKHLRRRKMILTAGDFTQQKTKVSASLEN